MQKVIVIVLLLLGSGYSYAQEVKGEASIGGQITASTNGEAVFLNMGGPGIKLTLSPKWAFSVNMLPSIKLEDKEDQPLATPTLGTGLQIYYKKLILIAPFYYDAPRNVWIVAGGIGYKF